MVEKFSDYEDGFIEEAGIFTFEVLDAEIKDSAKGSMMAVFSVKCPVGKTTIYHVIEPKSRWSYNKFIAACLNLSAEEKQTFELDYGTIHLKLVGKKFVGVVEEQSYVKEDKRLLEDGTYDTVEETRVSYKIISYSPAV